MNGGKDRLPRGCRGHLPSLRDRSRSMRAASVHFAPTVRWIFMRYSGGVCCTISDWNTKPVCLRCVTEEKPAAIFFWAPRSYARGV